MSGALSEELRREFVELARDAFGLVFPGSRLDALDDGVRAACASLGIAEPRVLLQRATDGEGAALVALADSLTVGETYFFRDPQHFDLLRRVLEQAREPVLLWSAGCSSGAEPYSMAILAREVHGDEAARRVQVLGTDLSPEALTAAREGVYRPWAFRGTSEAFRERWFRPQGSRLRVVDEVRDLVRFRRLNLLELDDEGWPHDVDVAFCRNVLVYFGDDAITRATAGLARALRRGGLLVAGPSDPLLTSSHLAIEPSAGFIAYRRVDGDEASPHLEPRSPAPRARSAAADPVRELLALPPPTNTPPAPAGAAPAGAPAEGAPRLPGDEAPRRSPGGEAPPPAAPGGSPRGRPAPVGGSTAAAPGPAEPGAAPAPAEDTVPPSPAAEAFDRARALADRGDTHAALAAIHAAIRHDPIEPRFYLLRALLRQAIGDHRSTLQDTRRTLLLDRDLIYAHLVAAPSAWVLGERRLARRSLRNARSHLAQLPPEAPIEGSGSTAAELLSACLQMERSFMGGAGV